MANARKDAAFAGTSRRLDGGFFISATVQTQDYEGEIPVDLLAYRRSPSIPVARLSSQMALHNPVLSDHRVPAEIGNKVNGSIGG